MHLQRQQDSYRIRLVVPKAIRNIVGQRELRYNIPTEDSKAAATVASRVVQRLRVLFGDIESGELMTTSLDIPALVRQFIDEGLEAVTYHHETGSTLSPTEYDDQQTSLELLRSDMVEAFAYRDRRKVQPVVDAFLAAKGIKIDRGSPVYLRLCTGILKASVQLLDRELNAHKVEPLQQSPVHTEAFPAAPAASPVESPQTPKHRMSSVMAAYWKENQPNWKPRTKTSYEKFRAVVLKQLGPETPVETIDHEAAGGFKKWLQSRKPALSGSTINAYLTFAGAIMRYAIRHGQATVNPFEGLKIKRKKKASADRDPFTVDDMVKLLNHPGYVNDSFKYPHRFWLPILGPYTGCRLEELCQLYVDQVEQVEGIWCLRIEEKHPEQSVKTGEVRVVPLHPVVVDLGFIRYVQSLDPAGRIFPELPRINNTYSHHYPRFHKDMRKKVGLNDGRKISFHSYRHTLTTHLRSKMVPETEVADLVGHVNSGMTYGRYGKPLQVREQYEGVVLKIEYEGLDLGHLKGSRWTAGEGKGA